MGLGAKPVVLGTASAFQVIAAMLRITVIFVGICLVNTASAQTQIYKCTDADGGIVYSQLPCVTEKAVEAESEPTVSTNPEPAPTEVPEDEPESNTSSAACKKRHRDAIDAIDAEIGREYSPDKAAQYKQRLLLLTRKLRDC